MFDKAENLENGWLFGDEFGGKSVETVAEDAFGFEIESDEEYCFLSELFGWLSSYAYKEAKIKDLKTKYDKIADCKIEDAFDGSIIEIGERYLALQDGPCKIMDDTTIENIDDAEKIPVSRMAA